MDWKHLLGHFPLLRWLQVVARLFMICSSRMRVWICICSCICKELSTVSPTMLYSGRAESVVYSFQKSELIAPVHNQAHTTLSKFFALESWAWEESLDVLQEQQILTYLVSFSIHFHNKRLFETINSACHWTPDFGLSQTTSSQPRLVVCEWD